ncbi:hypothetical protein RHODOP_04504 [Rhodoplanes sp. P11]
MDDITDIVERINRRLASVGLKAATASRRAGLSDSAIYNLRRGAAGKITVKGATAATFVALARVLETTPQWLMTGDGPETIGESELPAPPDRLLVPIKGYVGAGAETHYYAVAQGDLDEVEAPDGSTPDTVAVEIRGESLGSLFDRWLIFYDDVRRPVTDDLIGKLCVVGLADDRILVKRIRRGRNGLFDLESNRDDDTIKNVKVEWAAKVRLMTPK